MNGMAGSATSGSRDPDKWQPSSGTAAGWMSQQWNYRRDRRRDKASFGFLTTLRPIGRTR